MQNPFKKGEAVLTKVKRSVVEATVTQTWKNEVQVKSAAGDLLWRTIYTVWRAGEAPLTREPKTRTPGASKAGSNTAAPAKVVTPGQRGKTKKSPAKQSKKRR
jgi:hypothetical protein